MRLISDVVSHCNPKITYGYAGDEVSIIDESEKVCIVQHKSGHRFSCRKEYLTQEEVIPDPIPIEKPVETVTTGHYSVKKIKQKNVQFNNQKTLF